MNKIVTIGIIAAFLIVIIGIVTINESNTVNEDFQPPYAIYGEDTSSTVKILFKTTNEKEQPNSHIKIESGNIGGYANLYGLIELNVPKRHDGVYPLFISGGIDNFRNEIMIKDIDGDINAFELELFKTPRTYKLYWNNEFLEEYTVQFDEHTTIIDHFVVLENVNSINSLIIEDST